MLSVWHRMTLCTGAHREAAGLGHSERNPYLNRQPSRRLGTGKLSYQLNEPVFGDLDLRENSEVDT